MTTAAAFVRVFVDASYRGGMASLAAVILIPGCKPHVVWRPPRRVPSSAAAERRALYWGDRKGRQRQRRLERRVPLRQPTIIYGDNQHQAWAMQERNASHNTIFRWISRHHPMMRLAHRAARHAFKGL